MPNYGVKILLTQWGRWSRTSMPGRLPSMSTTEKARIGRGGTGDSEMPYHIAEIDHIVCTAEPTERTALIVYYAQEGSLPDKAARLGLTRSEFRARIERGESFVAINL
jgi:hypothetical protein